MTERGRVGESHILQVFLLFSAVIARSKATKQSILSLLPYGLLRCARNDGKSPVCVSVCDGDAVAAYALERVENESRPNR